MLNFLSVIVWFLAFAVRAVLFVIGLVVVPFTNPDNVIWGNNEHPVSPAWHMPGKPDWWRNYIWRAVRNPVNNVRFLIDDIEPSQLDEWSGDASPDIMTRELDRKSSWRWRRYKLFSEYWYQRKVGDEYFEFRIGWKIASGVPGLGLTLQLRKGS